MRRCLTCGEYVEKVATAGECWPCYQYRRRTGKKWPEGVPHAKRTND